MLYARKEKIEIILYCQGGDYVHFMLLLQITMEKATGDTVRTNSLKPKRSLRTFWEFLTTYL